MFFDEARCTQMLRGIFDAYYARVPTDHVVFDTNRTWTGRAALLRSLYPKSRIICCVRHVGWIIDSLERMRVRNPLKLSKLFGQHGEGTIYTRVEALMNSETGLIGAAWSGLREAWFSESAHRLIVVPYDTLVREPRKTLKGIYETLEEPWFEHDFRNVTYEAPDYDDNLGMPGLHTVHAVVAPRDRMPSIPPDVFAKYEKTHFWGQADLNPRKVLIL